jgi:hypothetical protein
MVKILNFWHAIISLALITFAGMAGAAWADDASFSEAANRICRQIIETRADGVLNKGRKAGAEVVAAALGSSDLPADLRRALQNDIAASRDELRRSLLALRDLTPPPGLRDDWDMIIALLEAETALQDNRLQWLESPAGILIPASEFGPSVELVDNAMERLGLAGRDCELISQDVDIPENHAAFVSRAAAACSDIVARQSRQNYKNNHGIALAAFLHALRGTLELPDPDLDAALSALEAEWRLSLAQLSDIPSDLAPDDQTWTRFLQAFWEMAEVQRSRLLVLRSADEDPSAAYRAIRSSTIDVDLAELSLENTDCRSIRF